MATGIENLPFEEPSFIQNFDSNLKLLLETFLMLDEDKMVVVLKQFYRIVKLLKLNKTSVKSLDMDKETKIMKNHSISENTLKNLADVKKTNDAKEDNLNPNGEFTIQQAKKSKQAFEIENVNKLGLQSHTRVWL